MASPIEGAVQRIPDRPVGFDLLLLVVLASLLTAGCAAAKKAGVRRRPVLAPAHQAAAAGRAGLTPAAIALKIRTQWES